MILSSPMALYLVHCHLPEITLDKLVGLQRAARATSERLTAQGQPVRLLQSTFVPSEGHMMCLFEASHPTLVRDVTELAQIPFTRIVEALDLGVSAQNA